MPKWKRWRKVWGEVQEEGDLHQGPARYLQKPLPKHHLWGEQERKVLPHQSNQVQSSCHHRFIFIVIITIYINMIIKVITIIITTNTCPGATWFPSAHLARMRRVATFLNLFAILWVCSIIIVIFIFLSSSVSFSYFSSLYSLQEIWVSPLLHHRRRGGDLDHHHHVVHSHPHLHLWRRLSWGKSSKLYAKYT